MKRKYKLLFLGLSTITVIGITSTIFFIKEKNQESKKYSNHEKMELIKQKFDHIDRNKTFLVKSEQNLNLSLEKDHQIIKKTIIEKINISLNKVKKKNLSKEEEKAIFIISNFQQISNLNSQIVIIKIKFDSLEYDYKINFKKEDSQGEFDQKEVNRIKNNIININNLIIDKDVDTSDDAKILAAIKAQLKIDNPTLSNSDLAKITDNISSLIPGVNTNVTLTITVSDQSDTINVIINRPFSDAESVTKAKKAINSLSTKEITISATSGTITTNKVAILSGLKALSGYSSLDLKGSTVTIKNSSTSLTPSGVSFTIIITKNSANIEITSEFTIKRSKTSVEINNDQVAAIKTKIKDTNLIIDKDVDTSDDAKILAAIKAQLQIENSTLSNNDLAKITDNISSLTPGINTNVILTITVSGQSDTINVIINRPFSDDESIIVGIKAKISNTNLTIDKDVDTSDDAKILAAIKAQLKIDNSTLSNSDLAKITDNISSLTPKTNTSVALTITVGLESDTISIIVNRPLSDTESVTKAKKAINSLSTKEITISATSGTITTNKVAILSGLKALSGYSSLDLKGTTVTIKNSSTTLTFSGVSFTIVITKNSVNSEITSGFTIKRSKTTTETNNDKIATIKAKITNTNLTIDKNIDTSNDAKILAAIKAQLKIDNSSLWNSDLAKITDNISSLTPGVNTNVTLTITIGSESDTIIIVVNRARIDAEDKALFDKVIALVDGGKKTIPTLYMNRTYLEVKTFPFWVYQTNPKVKAKILSTIASFKGDNNYQMPLNEQMGFIFSRRLTKITQTTKMKINFKIEFGNYEKNYSWNAIINTN